MNPLDLVTPGIGLIFWTSVVFLLLVFILKKFAWKPILDAVEKRSDSIEKAINAADEAKASIEQLNIERDKIKKESLAERDALLKEARDTKNKIISDAKAKAKQETDKILSDAREVIKNEKMAAITELKNQVAILSLEIAEKIVKDQLSSNDKQKALVDALVKDVNLN
ncbi:MAG: F0F1 ATP synthase subunit B [Bacteroidota bacterium]|nr:F0F1 ATP synthase subunit B [Bacteroidota bacterium]|tara:strand:- start:381 stop:884 length:504 start_codon:yes stop_codon:yes gene_type:complete